MRGTVTSRRRFLAGALAFACERLAAQEKAAAKVHRIGMLETLPIAANNANLAELHRGLKELGYEEGKSYVVLYRSADGHAERFPALVAELARQKIDVFLTRGTPATLAARDAEGAIPVVAAAISEPLEAPRGNVTGLTSAVSELGAKRLELLRALAPGMKRVGALVNPDNPASLATWKVVQAAAAPMNLAAEMIDVRKPDALAAALEAAVKDGIDGLVFSIETLTQANQGLIVEFTTRQRLPAVYASRSFVEAGGLLSYGASYPDLYYRAAAFIHKILKGAKPAELPIERPTKFELVINRKAAGALKIAIPPDLLLRSDDILD
jgi:putative ABC transport system substrate-binding protein